MTDDKSKLISRRDTNRQFLMNASKILEYDFKTSVKELIRINSFEFANNYIPGFDDDDFERMSIEHVSEALLRDESEKEADKKVADEEYRLTNSLENDSSFLLFLRCVFENKKGKLRKSIKSFLTLFEKEDFLTDDFWVFNSQSARNASGEEIERLKFYCYIAKSSIPSLSFDPKFQELLDTPAVQYFLSKEEKEWEKTPYFSPNAQLKDLSALSHYIDTKQFLYEMELQEKMGASNRFPDLSAESYVNAQLAHFCRLTFQRFADYTFITDFLEGFEEYFAFHLPSQRKYINTTFQAFIQLVKAVKGQIYVQWSLRFLKDLLRKNLSSEQANWFLDRFWFFKQYDNFESSRYDTPPSAILSQFDEFIHKCGVICLGQAYTGFYWIWKAVLKYIEELTARSEFRMKKGQLLEQWVLDCAQNRGFSAWKLIIYNTQSTHRGHIDDMLTQIQSFPSDHILSFSVPFPSNVHASYLEFDVVIQIQNHLLLCEAKSTAVEYGSFWDIIKWDKIMNKHLEQLKWKRDVLQQLVKRGAFTDSLLSFEDPLMVCLIKTEGIANLMDVFNMKGFELFLDECLEMSKTRGFEYFWNKYANFY